MTAGQTVSGSPRNLRVGVDSGGTFTDVTVFDSESGEIFIWKVSSTKDDPSRGIIAGFTEAVANTCGEAGAEISYFGHGTTVATNAVIEGEGVRTTLITTRGFRDVLEIARQVRPGIYNLKQRRPEPLARRDMRFELTERMLHDGTVATAMDEAELRAIAAQIRAAGVQAVAVCLINAYANPAHELHALEILREELPEAFLTISTDIASEYREFERSSTAVVNASVGPIIRDYLERLLEGLRESGVAARPYLTQSNGGVISFAQAQAEPVRTILSGPAAGVIGATEIAMTAGYPDIITFDMGGTSTDVALIQNGQPLMAREAEIHGHPLQVPMLDIGTVGAGGGSIAHVDQGGLLEVGPQSAGANPGPACYEKGNLEPTVTDANVLLAVLNPVSLLKGRMPISQEASRQAIQRLGEKLGVGTIEAAAGILSMAVANMAKAVRVISVERGHDPRDFTLVAFGGAGPLHATRLARELGMTRVLLPRTPGVLCSLGLLLSDLRTGFSASRLSVLDASNHGVFLSLFEGLETKAEAWFDREGVSEADRKLLYSLDLRYAGQGHQINVACDPALGPAEFAAAAREAFEAAHEQSYGYRVEGEAVQLTTLRLDAVARVAKVPLVARPDIGTDVQTACIASRNVYLAELGKAVPHPIYDRDLMGPGHVIHGPAIVEQMDSTALILPGQKATVDAWLNIIITEVAA